LLLPTRARQAQLVRQPDVNCQLTVCAPLACRTRCRARPDLSALRLYPVTVAGACVRLAGHTALPALVNAHDHLQLNCIPGLPDAEPFANSYEWAGAFARHFKDPTVKRARAVPAAVRHWQGALKNALCGATTVMHHDPVADVFGQRGFPVRTVQPCGWAHSLHSSYGPSVEESYHATLAGAGWFIHLGEGTDSRAAAELHELQRRDCLHANTVLVHAVALCDADIAQVIAYRAAVVWCPASNLRILGRTLSVRSLRRLFDAGCLALGTDSRLSGSRDLLQELQLAKAHSDFSARELLELATVRARRVLRTPPAREDCIVIRTDGRDPAEALLKMSRHQLRAVIRDGRPLLTDPDLHHWFVEHGIACMEVRLDGHPKLCASEALAPLQGPWRDLEQGLSFSGGGTDKT